MARDLGGDYLPYRDFFYANPPLLLLLLKIGGWLGGWGIVGMRMVPIFCHVVSGFTFFRILASRLHYWVAIPLGLYWFSYDSLRASTHATGISETLAMMGIAYLLAARKRPVLAGLFLGLGLWTKTYAITGLPGILVLMWFGEQDRRQWIKDLLWCLGVLLLSVVVLVLVGTCLGGKAFWEMNVFYHLSKQPSESGILPVFGQVWIRNQGSLYILGLTILLWVSGYWFGRNKQVMATSLTQKLPNGNTPSTQEPVHLIEEWRWIIAGSVHSLTVLVFLILQGRIFDFYLLLFLPALALLSGGFLSLAVKAWIQVAGQTNASRLQKTLLAGYCGVSVLFLAHPMIPRQQRLFMRELVTYWQHEERDADALGKWKDILDGDEAVMAGDSGTAPLIALLCGKRLALGEADTNQMRFQGGLPPAPVFIQELKDAGVQWLIVRGRRTSKGRFIPGGMFSLPEFKDYAQSDFGQVDAMLLEGDTEVRLMRTRVGLFPAGTSP